LFVFLSVKKQKTKTLNISTTRIRFGLLILLLFQSLLATR